ncbi:MAG: 23S rRNA (uracil(1939)-C(5))-methyltransferase RlmD [Clostridiaceae bacterium]|nr:23S rRNA (uracil(1939)-C(5))-methyltransferase RlmD [Clostridiaceae bacterium]
MKKNDIIELDITGMTHEGLGVGRKNGMAVFVEGAVSGEKVYARIIKVQKNYAVAEVHEWLNKSQHRQEPFCPVYESCGGCSLQHMSYRMQLEFKHGVVKDALEHIGGFQGITVNPVLGMNNPMHYRNKAQYPVGIGSDGKPVSGFYAKRSHQIIDFESCAIQDEISVKIRNHIIESVREAGIPAYDETTGKGILRQIITRTASTGVMVVLVVTTEKIPALKDLIQNISARFPEIRSIVLNINNRKGSVIPGEKNITVYGQDAISDRLGRYVFHISPLSFYQVNRVQTEILYEKVLEYADLTGNETVFDLYCGIGTISIFLAGKAKTVIGIESVKEAVEMAERNKLVNNISNIEFYHGKAEDITIELYQKGIKADVVVVDPPRKGCDGKLLETITGMRPARIVYVSCNPSTLARDLKYLAGKGYRIEQVQPVDMFPWTSHVECVALMSKVEK